MVRHHRNWQKGKAMAEETINQNPQEEQAQVNQNITFDYDKLASIIAGKQSVTEDSVLKGYFKQQGLTGDEMKSAIEMYKKDKASREPDINALNQKITDAESEIAKANSARLVAETKVEAMTMASELGVDQKTIPYLMKMADLSSVVADGQIDQNKLKESLNEVLKDLPQLKITAEDVPHGFKIGADTDKSGTTSNEELARIFGVSKKG